MYNKRRDIKNRLDIPFKPFAKEVAALLGYENTSRSVNDHVDELDQKMLSNSECKELFGNTIDPETVENTDNYRGYPKWTPEIIL